MRSTQPLRTPAKPSDMVEHVEADVMSVSASHPMFLSWPLTRWPRSLCRNEMQRPVCGELLILGKSVIRHTQAITPVVAERYRAPHPEPLLLRRGNLVADPLAGHLALELGEGEQHIEREPSHRGGGVELLRNRHERYPVGVEDLDHFREVGERTGQAVDFVNHHYIDEFFADVGQQP